MRKRLYIFPKLSLQFYPASPTEMRMKNRIFIIHRMAVSFSDSHSSWNSLELHFLLLLLLLFDGNRGLVTYSEHTTASAASMPYPFEDKPLAEMLALCLYTTLTVTTAGAAGAAGVNCELTTAARQQ